MIAVVRRKNSSSVMIFPFRPQIHKDHDDSKDHHVSKFRTLHVTLLSFYKY